MLPVNLHEYEEAARERLAEPAYAYVAGGAGDEVTLRGNREAFGRWRLLPRVMRGASRTSAATTVLGHEVSFPVLLAPVGMHRLVHPDGELASARAAARLGTIFTLSTMSTYSIEEVGAVARDWWFQLYVQRDREVTRDLVRRAEAAGAAALVVTLDTQVLGRREADERNRFAMPADLPLANFTGGRSEMRENAGGSAIAAYTGARFEPDLSWEDLDWLAGLTPLPVVAKGILAPDDARLATEHGARAVIVSNHGGRQLDSAVATLDALPAVARAVEDRAEVLLDGGVRRGTDVLKALALGARAVMLGRPYIFGLAADGEAGVVRVLELLRAEVANAMALAGCPTVTDIDQALVVPPGPLVPAPVV
ncbi:MAG TPA: alpha-hydroxy acid oxidase [Thermomicrobiaceae bacterium]|nr:alpha-hydroxy acid oxidase [Thermomicrobiaceae bacterium]